MCDVSECMHMLYVHVCTYEYVCEWEQCVVHIQAYLYLSVHVPLCVYEYVSVQTCEICMYLCIHERIGMYMRVVCLLECVSICVCVHV